MLNRCQGHTDTDDSEDDDYEPPHQGDNPSPPMELDPGPPYEGSEVHTSPENHDDSPPPRRPLIRLRPLRDVQTVTPEKRHSDDELPGGDEELARGHVYRTLEDADEPQPKTSPNDEDKERTEAMGQSYDLHVQNLTGETMTRDSTASSITYAS